MISLFLNTVFLLANCAQQCDPSWTSKVTAQKQEAHFSMCQSHGLQLKWMGDRKSNVNIPQCSCGWMGVPAGYLYRVSQCLSPISETYKSHLCAYILNVLSKNGCFHVYLIDGNISFYNINASWGMDILFLILIRLLYKYIKAFITTVPL